MLYTTAVYDAVSTEERKLFAHVGDLLWSSRVPGNEAAKQVNGMIFECHSICRAIILEIRDGSLRLVDGEVWGCVFLEDGTIQQWSNAHSWLETKHGHIIDPYPVNTISTSPLLLPRVEGVCPAFTTGRYRVSSGAVKDVDFWNSWRKARMLKKTFCVDKLKAAYS